MTLFEHIFKTKIQYVSLTVGKGEDFKGMFFVCNKKFTRYIHPKTDFYLIGLIS